MTRRQALARLGLIEGASAEEIKSAYRKLAFDLHPDLHPENASASREFQFLNEAYVLLTAPEQAGARQRRPSRPQERAAATEKARAEAQRAYERAKKRFHEEEQAAKSGKKTEKPADDAGPKQEKTREMKREEVLRDLLRDPFARRVFEDIYNQIKQEAASRRTSAHDMAAEPGLLERTADNVSGWLRRQIDEEQTVRVAGPLTPGKRIRLQIHSGIFGKSQVIEMTLPPLFEPGSPIRLKGLGKRIGNWRGDLYLRIVNQ